MTGTLPIRPDQHADRAKLRSCRNCTAYDRGRCKRGAPGPQGWPEVDPTEFCLLWTWVIEPRVGWGSAIAPAEYRHAQEEVPF